MEFRKCFLGKLGLTSQQALWKDLKLVNDFLRKFLMELPYWCGFFNIYFPDEIYV